MSGRHTGAAILGALAGFIAFAAAMLGGYVLYRRLLNGSAPALAAILAGTGVIGAYAGWLLGLLVFSAVREQNPEDASSQPG